MIRYISEISEPLRCNLQQVVSARELSNPIGKLELDPHKKGSSSKCRVKVGCESRTSNLGGVFLDAASDRYRPQRSGCSIFLQDGRRSRAISIPCSLPPPPRAAQPRAVPPRHFFELQREPVPRGSPSLPLPSASLLQGTLS